MATQQISILGPGTLPDDSGDVFLEPYSVKDSGAAIAPMVLVFNDSGAKDGLRGSFVVPQDYVGSASLKTLWTANATSGAVVWDLSYLTRAAGEDMGAAATDTTDTVTDTKSATAFDLEIAEISVTSADFTAGDVVTFELFRDGANASDTMAAAAIVFDVVFEYDDA